MAKKEVWPIDFLAYLTRGPGLIYLYKCEDWITTFCRKRCPTTLNAALPETQDSFLVFDNDNV